MLVKNLWPWFVAEKNVSLCGSSPLSVCVDLVDVGHDAGIKCCVCHDSSCCVFSVTAPTCHVVSCCRTPSLLYHPHCTPLHTNKASRPLLHRLCGDFESVAPPIVALVVHGSTQAHGVVSTAAPVCKLNTSAYDRAGKRLS